MLLHLAEQLDVPLRERNVLLAAAATRRSSASAPSRDPALAAAGTAIDLVLAGHEPFPAIAVDRHWKLVSANKAVGLLLAGGQDLLRQPVNALRVALHPNGLAPRTVNLAVWRAHLLARLRRQIELTADPDLIELLNELQKYPAARSAKPPSSAPPDAAVVLRRTSSVRWRVLRDRVPTSLVSSPRRLPAPRTTASSKMSDSPDEWSPTRTGGLSAEEHPQRYRVRGSLRARRLAPLLYRIRQSASLGRPPISFTVRASHPVGIFRHHHQDFGKYPEVCPKNCR